MSFISGPGFSAPGPDTSIAGILLWFWARAGTQHTRKATIKALCIVGYLPF
jgi:hypothetical protein